MTIDLIGYMELRAVNKLDTRNKKDNYWIMQVSRRKVLKKNKR